MFAGKPGGAQCQRRIGTARSTPGLLSQRPGLNPGHAASPQPLALQLDAV